MSLDKSQLGTALGNAFATYPTTRDAGALAIASAYDTYAKQGQCCSGATPTAVNLSDLQDGLKAALNAGGSYSDVAQAFADAFEDYWDNGTTKAAFGATGEVVAVGGTSSLKSGLETLWQTQSLTLTLFPASGVAHADLLDAFTKLVTAKDTAVPCGPSPIS